MLHYLVFFNFEDLKLWPIFKMSTFNFDTEVHFTARICIFRPNKNANAGLLFVWCGSIVYYINFREVVGPCDPPGSTLPVCGAPTHPGWLVMAVQDGWTFPLTGSQDTQSPKNHREATGSNNICSNVFDHSCYCAEMGHGCQRRIKHLVVVWVSGISDGPFSPCCQRCFLRFQSWQCFSAEELKSFRAFPLFCSLMMTDCSSLLAEGHYFFFVVVPV